MKEVFRRRQPPRSVASAHQLEPFVGGANRQFSTYFFVGYRETDSSSQTNWEEVPTGCSFEPTTVYLYSFGT
eukprot:3136547-Pyramimonas_sp.AAC.1